MDAHNIAHTFHNVSQSVTRNDQQHSDEINDDMPSLEPIPTVTATDLPPAPVHDHDMSTASRAQEEDDDDSMPELQSVSNSSASDDSESDRDANEVEMQAVDDDHDSAWTDEDTSQMHGIETNVPRGINRRARVEDDEDEERDRRHPSHRVGDAVNDQSINHPNDDNNNPIPPTPQQQPPNPPPVNPNGRVHATFNFAGFPGTVGGPDPFQFFQQRMRGPNQNPTPNAPQTQDATTNADNPNNDGGHTQPMMNGFAITIVDGMPVLQPPPFQDGTGRVPRGFATFQEFLGLFGNALGVRDREPEDPERAKRLVDGLEEVPIGLVRRLECVGASGAGNGESGGSGGDSGCAICWDRLLDNESDGFGADTEATSEDNTTGDNRGSINPTTSDDGGPVASSSSPSATSLQQPTEPAQPKIVTLPCAHVFHASCLIPWFSRPMQTTCPTCRFNIDPENLTYVRRQNPPAPAADQPTPTPVPATGADAAPNPLQSLEEQVDALIDATDSAQTEEELRERLRVLRAARESVVSSVRALQHGLDLADAAPRPEDAGPPTAPASDIDDETHPDPPLPPLNEATPAPGEAEMNPGPNPNPRDGGNFITIGFDVFITGGGPEEMMRGIDADDAMEGDIDFGWGFGAGRDGQGGGIPPRPPPQFLPFTLPALGAGGNGGIGAGPGMQFATGTGRTINEAFTSMFGNGAAGFGGPPTGPAPAAGGAPPTGEASADTNTRDGTHDPPLPLFPEWFGGWPSDQQGAQQGDANLNANPGDASTNAVPPPPPHPGISPFSRMFEPWLTHILPPGPPPAPTHPPLPPLGARPQFANLFAAFPGPFRVPPARGAPHGADPTAPPPTRESLPFPLPTFPFDMGMGGPRRAPRQPREKKVWTLPPAPGPTLRQRIERKEREAGLRCYDVSCGVGPSDEEPFAALTEATKKQLSIRALRTSTEEAEGGGGAKESAAAGSVCSHTFHPPCLVSAARVALMGEDATVVNGNVEVACSVCRGVGNVAKRDWDEGVQALA